MQVNNNISAFNVWTNYTKNVTSLRKSMSKLSSGSRINNAGDDPSGLAMSERLRTQKRNTAAAANNVENKLNYLQTADSWTQKIHDMLGRMGELAVMANDGTKSTIDRTNLQKEFTQMQAEIMRIAGATAGDATTAAKFNGIALFQNSTPVSQQVGADGGQVFTSLFAQDLTGTSTEPVGTKTWSDIISDSATDMALDDVATNTALNLEALKTAQSISPDSNLETVSDAITALTATNPVGYAAAIASLNDVLAEGTVVGTDTLDAAVLAYAGVDTAASTAAGLGTTIRINTAENAATTVTDVNNAIDFLSGQRADLGAEMKRMEHTLDGLRTYEENIGATESRIRDVDVARETSEMAKYSILQQVGTAMLAQANQSAQGVLQLLG
jgi:flagellin